MGLMDGGAIIRSEVYELESDGGFRLEFDLTDRERAMLAGRDLGVIVVAVPKEDEEEPDE